MGYYSEVAIKCEEKAYQALKEACKNAGPDGIYKDGNYFIFYWDWTKWYDFYDDIAAIENIMDELDQLEEVGYGYKFLRLGENDNDVEHRENNGGIELWMLRKIDIPEGLEEVEI